MFQSDVLEALSSSKPSVNDEDIKEFQKYIDDFGGDK